MTAGLFDNHTHTQFSPDSRMTMEQGVKAAEAAGLGGICFSEHYDWDAPDGNEGFVFEPDIQQSEIEKLKGTTGIKLLRGAEVGVMPETSEYLRTFVSSYPFDSVIASLHFIDGYEPIHGTYYTDSPSEHYAYGHYLETFFQCIKTLDDFDILGHFDYIARYSPYQNHTITYDEYDDIFDSILSFLVERGRTFEINTKTYRPFKNGTPELDDKILIRFLELGGEAVSFGSDAHDDFCVARNFDLFAKRLQNLGFRYHVHFEERKPVYLPFA